jgi:AcrR family transcriptional regulator
MAKPKSDKKNNDIKLAALSLIVKNGFYGVKMPDIAAKAKIATGTVYIYFKTKEDLINELFLDVKHEIAQLFLPTDDFTKQDPIKQFKSYWLAYFNYCFNNPEKMLFVEQFLHSGYLYPSTIKKADQLMHALDDFISYAQTNNFLIKTEIELVKAQLSGPIHEVIKLNMDKKIKLTNKTINECYEMALNSLIKK